MEQVAAHLEGGERAGGGEEEFLGRGVVLEEQRDVARHQLRVLNLQKHHPQCSVR